MGCKCSIWKNSVFLRHSVCIAFNKSSLFSNQQHDLGLFQCHPKPSIWPWTFCSESLYTFSLWNTICPILIDFFGSQQMSAYQFDLGQFQCHPKPPIWLEPPLPHSSFYSSLLFSFKLTFAASFSMGQFVQRPPIWLSARRCHSCLFRNYFRQYFTTFVCQTGVNGDQFSANWAEKRYFRIFQTQSVEGCSWCSWCMQRCIETVWIIHDAAFPQIRKRRFPKVTVLSRRKTFPKFWLTHRL